VLPQLVQAHGIQALEDVPALAIQRGTAMRLVKMQNIFKARHDAFLARGSAGNLERGNVHSQRIEQVRHRPSQPWLGSPCACAALA
jgi:hypothetical protein